MQIENEREIKTVNKILLNVTNGTIGGWLECWVLHV